MDKIAAMARNAEIRGAMAAFVDAGLVKVAGQEAFDTLVEDVDARLGAGDYDLQKVAMATDAAIADYAAKKAQGQTKTAAQQELEHKAALGDLLLQKMAGQISDEDFVKQAWLMGSVRAGRLTDEEAAALKEHYGMDPKANLVARNIGREYVYGNLGGLGGSLAGAGLGAAAAALSKGRIPVHLGVAGGLGAGALAGGIAGSMAGTNKYSKGNAQKIMAAKQQAALEEAPVYGA